MRQNFSANITNRNAYKGSSFCYRTPIRRYMYKMLTLYTQMKSFRLQYSLYCIVDRRQPWPIRSKLVPDNTMVTKGWIINGHRHLGALTVGHVFIDYQYNRPNYLCRAMYGKATFKISVARKWGKIKIPWWYLWILRVNNSEICTTIISCR